MGRGHAVSTTIYHCHVDLSSVLKRREVAIAALRTFDPTCRFASETNILARAIIMQAQGRTAWPLCKHHDAKGHCKGHTNETR